MKTEQQMKLANEIFKLISDAGYECKLNTTSCRYDIEVEIGTIKKDPQLTIARVAVFWEKSDTNHEIGYLGAGWCHFDGYEVHRGWNHNIAKSDILSLIRKDILELADFQKRINKL